MKSFEWGTQIAVDAWKGRLWIICNSCGRWNLAPIEERWEPVEEAEELFRNAKMRVQSENIGLARLSDGTRLIRIGKALEGEVAAWRYGGELRRRRRHYTIAGGVAAAAGLAIIGGWLTSPLFVWGGVYLIDRFQLQTVGRISKEDGPDLIVRRWHVEGIHVHRADGEFELQVRDAHKKRNWETLAGQVSPRTKDIEIVRGGEAARILARALVCVNQRGGTPASISSALSFLESAGSSHALLDKVGTKGFSLGRRAGQTPNPIPHSVALAVEMAVNEDAELVAFEGELAGLRAAWAEAEEIAAIADSLPDSRILRAT